MWHVCDFHLQAVRHYQESNDTVKLSVVFHQLVINSYQALYSINAVSIQLLRILLNKCLNADKIVHLQYVCIYYLRLDIIRYKAFHKSHVKKI